MNTTTDRLAALKSLHGTPAAIIDIPVKEIEEQHNYIYKNDMDLNLIYDINSHASLDTTPTPLWLLLYMIERGKLDVFGAIKLVHWLSPIAYPEQDRLLSAPSMLLEGNVIRNLVNKFHVHPDVIYTCLMDEVLPKLNTSLRELK